MCELKNRTSRRSKLIYLSFLVEYEECLSKDFVSYDSSERGSKLTEIMSVGSR